MFVQEIVIPWTTYSSNFNPSIIQLSNKQYLVSYNSYRRYSIEESATVPPEQLHPWFGGPGSFTYWSLMKGGRFGIFFLILDIYQNKITHIDTVDGHILDAMDMRLTVIDNRLFGSYGSDNDPQGVDYQVREDNDGHLVRIGEDRQKMNLPSIWKSCCHLIHALDVKIIQDSKGYKFFGDNPEILCQNLSLNVEKNWSTWDYYGPKISYHLVPRHTVFEFRNSPNDCIARFEPSTSNFFDQTEFYYQGSIFFSCSTPAIPFAGRYLAVGHLKLFPDTLFESFTLGKRRNQELKDLPGHALRNIRYFMFFYTFDPETLSILEVSNSFIPPGATSNVVFPTGLILNSEGQIIVSYGERDDKMKLLFISPEELQGMLRTDLTPETFDFVRY